MLSPAHGPMDFGPTIGLCLNFVCDNLNTHIMHDMMWITHWSQGIYLPCILCPNNGEGGELASLMCACCAAHRISIYVLSTVLMSSNDNATRGGDSTTNASQKIRKPSIETLQPYPSAGWCQPLLQNLGFFSSFDLTIVW